MFFVRVSANLAQKVGVRRETIVFLEKEKFNPSLKLAHDLAVPQGLDRGTFPLG